MVDESVNVQHGCGFKLMQVDIHIYSPCYRKIMDSGKLDFYEHTKVCSNTCRSTKIDLTGARVSLSSQTSTEYIPLTPASADGM